MATLGKDMSFPTINYGAADIQTELSKEEAALKDIEARLPVLHFQRGDGYALYAVASMRPLVLRWIPYGDAWRAEAATIRGLRPADVQQMLDGQAKARWAVLIRKGLPS